MRRGSPLSALRLRRRGPTYGWGRRSRLDRSRHRRHCSATRRRRLTDRRSPPCHGRQARACAGRCARTGAETRSWSLPYGVRCMPAGCATECSSRSRARRVGRSTSRSRAYDWRSSSTAASGTAVPSITRCRRPTRTSGRRRSGVTANVTQSPTGCSRSMVGRFGASGSTRAFKILRRRLQRRLDHCAQRPPCQPAPLRPPDAVRHKTKPNDALRTQMTSCSDPGFERTGLRSSNRHPGKQAYVLKFNRRQRLDRSSRLDPEVV